MSNPIPGEQYTVEFGEDLEIIAAKAYGNSKRARGIFNANQSVLKLTDWKAVEEGTKIIIPILPDFEALKNEQRA